MSPHTQQTLISDHFSDNANVELLKSNAQFNQLTQHKVTLVATDLLPDEEKNRIITKIQSWQKDVNYDYLSNRFAKYNTLLISRYEDDYSAIFFLHTFEHQGSCYLYIGPVFSPSYISFGLTVCYLLDYFATNVDSLKVIAEVQNPEVVLYWYSVMPTAKTYPRIDTSEISAQAIEDVKCFTQMIDHIPAVDFEHFKTNSSSSLFKSKASHRTILTWLNTRGVNPEHGDSPLILSEITTEDMPAIVYKAITYINTYPAKRNEFMASLKDTLHATANC